MAREIDERIVRMMFDNQQFEREVKTSLSTLDKLKASLDLDGAADSFKNFQDTVNSLDLSKALKNNLWVITKFNMIGDVFDKVASKITNAVKSMSVDQITAGWKKYEDMTSSVQTIMAATAQDFEDTGEQMEYVNKQLSKLNWYTDETSYNLTDMTSNIGKFTNNGIKLDDAVSAMEGVANWAGISGATISEASRAMYNLSQAMSVGSVKLIDWKSIENANMATREFKQQAIDTALAMGTLKKAADGTIYSGDNIKHVVSATNFNEWLKDEWFSSDVLTTVLKRYSKFTDTIHSYIEEMEGDITTSEFIGYVDKFADEATDKQKLLKEAMHDTGLSAERLTEMFTELNSSEYDLGRRSFKAAQEAKTWSEALSAVQDAVSTGWMTTFQTIFGNYLEAKELWTNVANELWDVFAGGGEKRNAVLKEWAITTDELGRTGRDLFLGSFGNIWTALKNTLYLIQEAVHEVFGEFSVDKLMGFSKWLNNITSYLAVDEESIEKIAGFIRLLLKPIGVIRKTIHAILVGLNPLLGLLDVFRISLEPLLESIINVGEHITGVIETIRGDTSLDKVTETVSKISRAIVRFISGVGKPLISFLTIIFESFDKTLTYFKSLKSAGVSSFNAFFASIRRGIKWFVTNVLQLLTDITGLHFTDWIEPASKAISTGIKNLKEKVKVGYDYLASLYSNMQKVYLRNGGGLAGGIQVAFYSIGKVVKDGLHFLAQKTGLTWLDNIGSTIFNAFQKARTAISEFFDKISFITEPIKNAVGGIFKSIWQWLFGVEDDPLEEAAESVEKNVERVQVAYKSVKDMALEFIRGDWGNGEERTARVLAAGYDKQKVQDVVNLVWSLDGAFKEGAEDILAQWENVDARLEGGLPKKPLKEGVKLVRQVGDGIEKLYEVGDSKSAEPVKPLSLQLQELKTRILGALPLVASSIGKMFGMIKIGIKTAIKSVVDFIEKYQVIDRVSNGIASFFKAVIEFFKMHGPEIIDFIKDVASNIWSVIKMVFKEVNRVFKFIKGVFRGTKPLFDNLLSSLFAGDWSNVGKNIADLFNKLHANFKVQFTLFAKRISKIHNPLSEVVKLVIIWFNVLRAAWSKIFGFIFRTGDAVATETPGAFRTIIYWIKLAAIALSGFFSNLGKIFDGTKEIFEKLQLALMLSQWDTAGKYISQFFEKIKSNINATNPALGATIDLVAELLKEAKSKIWTKITKIWGGFKEIFKGTNQVLKKLFKDLLSGDWTKVKRDLTIGWKNIWTNFNNVMVKAVRDILMHFPTLLNAFSNIRDFFVNNQGNIQAFGAAVSSTVSTVKEKVGGVLGTVFANTKESFSAMIADVVNGDWGQAKIDAGTGLKTIWDNITSSLSSAWDKFEEKHPRIASIFEDIKNRVGGIFDNIKEFLERHAPEFKTFWETISTKFEEIAGDIGEGVGSVIEWISTVAGEAAPVLDNFISAILTFDWETVKSLIIEGFKSLGEKIREGADTAITIGGEGLSRLISFVTGMFSFLSNTFSGLGGGGEVGEGVEESTDSFLEEVAGSLATVFGAPEQIDATMSEMTSQIEKDGKINEETFQNLLSIFDNTSGIVANATTIFKNFKMASIFGSLGTMIKGFSDVGKNLSGALEGLKNLTSMDSVKQIIKWQGRKKLTDSILDICLSLLAVVGAIYLLGTMSDEQLQQGLDAALKIGIAIVIFYGLITGITKFANGKSVVLKEGESVFQNNTTSLTGLGISMLGLGVAVLLIMFAMKGFAKMKTGELVRGTVMVAIIMVLIAGTIIAIARLSKHKGKEGEIDQATGLTLKIGGAILALAVAMLVMTAAVAIFSNIAKDKNGNLIAGILAVAALLLVFALAVRIMAKASSTGEVTFKVAGAIIALAVAVLLLTVPMAIFAKMSWSELAKGLIGCAALMLALGIAVGIMGKAAAGMKVSGVVTAILMVITIVGALAGVMFVLQKFPFNLSITQTLSLIGILSVLFGGSGLIAAIQGLVAGLGSGGKAFASAISSIALVGEALGLLYGVVKILNDNPIKFKKKDVKVLTDVMESLYGFIAELAIISVAENSVFKSHGGNVFSGALSSLIGTGGILVEVVEFYKGIVSVMSQITIDDSWSTDMFGKNGKIDAVKQMLLAVGEFAGAIAAVNVTGNFVDKYLLKKDGGSKGFMDNIKDAVVDAVQDVTVLGEVVGVLYGVLDAMSKNTISDSWTTAKVAVIKDMLLAVGEFAAAIAAVRVTGDFLSATGKFGGSLKGFEKLKGIGLDVASEASALMEVLGVLWAVLAMMDEYQIDDGWTKEKVGMVGALALGVIGVAEAVGRIPTAGLEGIKNAFFVGLTADALVAPIILLIEAWALIDGVFHKFGLSIGDMIDRIVTPIGDMFESIGTSAGEIMDALDRTNSLDPKKVQPLVDILECVKEMGTDIGAADVFLAWITGDNKWDLISEGLVSIASGFAQMTTELKDTNTNKVRQVLPLFRYLNELISVANASEGYSFDYNITGFVSAIGEAIESWIGLDADAVNAAAGAFTDIVDSLIKIGTTEGFNGDNLNNALGETLTDFTVYGIKEMSDAFTSDEAVEAYEGGLTAMVAKFKDEYLIEGTTYYNDFTKAFEDFAGYGLEKFKEMFTTSTSENSVSKVVPSSIKSLADAIQGWTTGTTNYTYAKKMYDAFCNLAKTLLARFRDTFSISIINSYIYGPNGAATNFENVAKPAFTLAGINVVQGLINGINSRIPALATATRTMANITENAFSRPLLMRSPSRLFEKFGGYIGEGLIIGMENMYSPVSDASTLLATEVVDTMSAIVDMATEAVESDSCPVITPVVDMANVYRSSDLINGMFTDTAWTAYASATAARAADVGGVRSYDYNPYPQPVDYNNTIAGIRSDINTLSQSIQHLQVVMDSGALVGQIAGPMDNALGRRVTHKARRN